ncbi:MAG: site-2 protease family protein [Dermatophilaceae bacterium]
MTYVLGVLVVVAGVALSIALHEIGHLVPAKRFGVRCSQYMIGFGPTLWSKTKGETQYGLKAIPLGGYVRMIGMYPPRPGGRTEAGPSGRFGALIDEAREESAREIGPGDENRVFYKLSVPKKLVVMLGGPTMNLALATGLLAVAVSGIGTPTLVPTLSSISACVPSTAPTVTKPQPDCLPGDPQSPAAKAGLQVGDTILAVGPTRVSTWAEATAAIRSAPGSALELTVDRGGSPLAVPVSIAALARPREGADGRAQVRDGALVTETVGFLGASPSRAEVRQPLSSVPGVMGDMLGATGSALLGVPAKMVGVFQSVTGQAERDPDGPMSVVGVGRLGGELTSGALGIDSPGAVAFLLVTLLVGLNLALFFFNLLPLLPLDGGHAIGAVWEGLKRRGARLLGRPDPGYVDVAKGLPIAYAVSTLVIVMSVLLVYADFVAPVRLAG